MERMWYVLMQLPQQIVNVQREKFMVLPLLRNLLSIFAYMQV